MIVDSIATERIANRAHDRRFARRPRFFKNIQPSEEDMFARNLEDDVSSRDDVVSYNSHNLLKKMLRTIVLERNRLIRSSISNLQESSIRIEICATSQKVLIVHPVMSSERMTRFFTKNSYYLIFACCKSALLSV